MQERTIRRRRWAITLGIAAALTMTMSACDWAQLGYGASRTYFNPTESGPAVGGIHESLHIEPPAGTQGWPIVVGTRMITLSAGELDEPGPASLRAYSTTDGTLLWTRQVSPATIGAATPAASAGTVYAAVSLANDGTSRVMAVDVDDGSVQWTTTLPAVASLSTSTARMSDLAITSGRVIVERTAFRNTDPFYAGFTAGLDPATGAVAWTHASPYGFNYGTAIAGHTILHSMEKEIGYLEHEDTVTMEAIDTRTGAATWTDRSFDGVLGFPQGGGDVFIGPAISSGGSFLGTATLDADSGEPILIQSGYLMGPNPPQVVTDRSMIFSSSSQLNARGIRTPGLQWIINAPDGVMFGLPTVAGSVLYVVATDATGSTLETYDVRTGTALDHVSVADPGRPIIANGRLFLVTDGISGVYVYDLS